MSKELGIITIDLAALHPDQLVPLLQLLNASRCHAKRIADIALDQDEYESAAVAARNAADLDKAARIVDAWID